MRFTKPSKYMQMRQRNVIRTVGRGVLWTLAALLLLVGLGAVFAAPLAEAVATRALTARGFGPAALDITKLSIDGISVRNVSALGGAVTLAEADITFTFAGLTNDKRIDAVRVDGVVAKAVWTPDGKIMLGPRQLFPVLSTEQKPVEPATPAEPTAPPPKSFSVRSIVAGNSKVIMALPDREISTALNATYVEDEATGRAVDVTATSTGPGVATTTALSMVAAPDKPAQGSGTTTYKLDGLDLPGLANDLTGEGAVTVSFDANGARTENSRADLALSFPNPPAPLAAVGVQPNDPVRIALGGINSRLFNFTLDRTKPTPTVEVNGLLTLATGPISLKVEVDGWMDAPGGGEIPQDFHIRRLNATGTGLQFGGGSGEALLVVTDLKGPIGLAEGKLFGQIKGQKLTQTDRFEATFDSLFRLDGLALSFDVKDAYAEADNLKLGSAVAAGENRIALAANPKDGPAPAQQVNIVFGSSSTLAVNMSFAGALPKILTAPDATPATLTFPTVTLGGYLSQGKDRAGLATRTGSIHLKATDGQFTHPMAHLGEVTADLAADGKTLSGPVSWVLLEAPDPTRPRGLDRRGGTFKSNLTIDSESIVFKGKIESQNQIEVGTYSFTQQSDQPPRIALDIPVRTWMANPSFIEVFGPVAGLTNTSGTFGVEMKGSPSDTGFNGTLKLAFADFGFTLGSMVVKDLNSVIALTQIWPPKAALPQRISVGQLVAGVPFQNGDFTVALNGDKTALVSNASLKLAGGSVTGKDFVVPLDGGNRSFVMDVANVDLEGLVKAFTTDGLTATGKLSGSLPLRLQNSRLYIDKAQMVGKDGTIQYRPSTPPAALAQGGGTILLQALENFQFTEVIANINGNVTQDLGVGLTLKGKNPGLYGGYPIEFNLSLDGPLNQLVREGLSGYRIPEDIKQRLQQQGISAPN
jgi:hypothetical protein